MSQAIGTCKRRTAGRAATRAGPSGSQPLTLSHLQLGVSLAIDDKVCVKHPGGDTPGMLHRWLLLGLGVRLHTVRVSRQALLLLLWLRLRLRSCLCSGCARPWWCGRRHRCRILLLMLRGIVQSI